MEVLDKAKTVFSRYGIEPDEKEGQLRTFIRTGVLGSRLRLIRTEKFLTVKIELPVFAPEYRKAAMAETACRVNWSLVQGRFEVDLADDAELRFTTTMPLLDGDPTESQIDCLVFQSWSIANHFIGAFVDVAITGLDPDTAIQKAEANWQEKIRNEAPNEAEV